MMYYQLLRRSATYKALAFFCRVLAAAGLIALALVCAAFAISVLSVALVVIGLVFLVFQLFALLKRVYNNV